MIEMQYNFPLLPEQPAQWRERLKAAVGEMRDDAYDEMRPTFRMSVADIVEVGARWMNMPAERTYLVEGNHQGSLIAKLASGVAGKPIAVDAAAYTGAMEQARALGCPLVAIAVDGEGMVASSLREKCEEARAARRPIAATYVIPTVHNPLGSVASLARREELVTVAREFDLGIVEDDAYGYMAPDAPPPIATLAPERTFYIRGLSKSYAPAARTGFIVAPEKFADGMWRAIKNAATGANLPQARASVGLIEDGSLDRIIAEKVVEGRHRNAAARAALLAACGHTHCWDGASAAWHLWVMLPSHVSPQSFEARMAERGVLISGGNWFAADANSHLMPNGFRMALGGEVDGARTQRGVDLVAVELAKAWS
jgi:DNA-binding transcriptional MocR family regulator